MKTKQFKTFVKELNKIVPVRINLEELDLVKNRDKVMRLDYYDLTGTDINLDDKNLNELVLVDHCETDGVRGRTSCPECGGEGESYINRNQSYKEYLDIVLEKYASNLTFSEYNEIKRNSKIGSGVKKGEYGNFASYNIRELSLKWLYKYLVNKDYLICK